MHGWFGALSLSFFFSLCNGSVWHHMVLSAQITVFSSVAFRDCFAKVIEYGEQS